MQTSLTQDVQFVGTGLHSGRPARLTLHPASVDHGIWFRRTDERERDNLIPAKFDAVSDTRLNTRLSNAAGVSVSTVEHLMAALAGCGLHNVLIDIDGPEVPIMDGSAKRFVREILAAGLVQQRAPIRALRILKTVEHREGDAEVRLEPFEGFRISFEIDFPDAAIGRQDASFDMQNGTFVRELSDCRTFCRRADVDAMQAAGLALGGSLDNAIVVEGGDVLNPGGFRRANECVRHKMLDALGDLSLAGMPIIGHYTGKRAGHGPSNRLLRTLFATPGAFEVVTCTEEQTRRLPGFGIRPSDLAKVG
ncbi:UDP-3-O-acyl-N-acetylglucosamine deacetylase [Algicella marina]|uniref:UDP-3-O-acyl-N-acetylglucosamine deacetylase n=1 Tax=Algicella marina TaxID=2683284 RepID=A0A6P1SWB4_9RHOB|nr:UDP-3-O-acyl-N-acetylglucosamine deacetylase [Algicella marina]QHQ34057.1 UDP-3-O-acyl-N-acetylglucosamine deacetylase [Algicella marina]